MTTRLKYPAPVLVHCLKIAEVDVVKHVLSESDLPEEMQVRLLQSYETLVGELVASVKRTTGLLPKTHAARWRKSQDE